MNKTFGALVQEGVLEFSDGYRTRKDQLADEGFRILRVSDVHDGWIGRDGQDFVARDLADRIGQKFAREGDLLLTTKGTIGRVAVVPDLRDEALVYSPQLCYFRVRDEAALDSKYLRYWFSSSRARQQIRALSSSTDMAPYLSLRDIRAMSISLPDLAVQRRIGEVLGALDDKIAANRRAAALSYGLMDAIVGASEKVDVPLFDAFSFTFGGAFKGEHFSEPGVGRPLIRIRDLKSQRCQIWTTEALPKEQLAEPGALLVGMDAEFRPTMWTGDSGLVNQRVMSVTSEKYGPAVSRVALSDPLLRIERSKVATTVIHLNKSDLHLESAAVPSEEELGRIRAAVDPLYSRCVAASVESDLLASTRDELLPLLMSGRITVTDAERAAGDVL
ncbi:restriction endonuclease subunit S [Corynebacterium sp.]|uniref:restriction endonuclease subunit S n=1 Tax=Corynebacterium sp. TaxID=1720 RepID=UPI0026DEAF24|nr:restriction endonuclease subunit S [Corynebacterium sp.]MDO5512695.1 restriction endonuclease subunit S [Corynebacterium sp.]